MIFTGPTSAALKASALADMADAFANISRWAPTGGPQKLSPPPDSRSLVFDWAAVETYALPIVPLAGF